MSEDGEPAMPTNGIRDSGFTGWTAREYASIYLGVPDSGTPWLDKMILQGRRMDFAGIAMQTLRSQLMFACNSADYAKAAQLVFAIANAMVTESQREKEEPVDVMSIPGCYTPNTDELPEETQRRMRGVETPE